MKKQLIKSPLLQLIFISIIMAGCNQSRLNPNVERYLTTALDSIQQNALKSSDVDWKILRKEVFSKAIGAQTTEEVYNAIIYAIEKLDDNHSFLQKHGANLSFPSNKENKKPSPYGSRMQVEHGLHVKEGKKFARIFVPQGMRGNKFAQDLQDKIFELTSNNPCGWIVDLRGNGGGNMWPMLAGIGPLAGENPLGGSENGKGEQDFYHYDNGKAIYIGTDGKEESWAQAEEKVEKLDEEIPIAFLIDGGTASSGEALAVIFKGRKNTRSFGEKTYGASTSTRGIMLSDSLNLVLAVSTFQDRNGNLYINGVEPDVEIPIGNEILSPDEDPVIETAINWLNQNCNN